MIATFAQLNSDIGPFSFHILTSDNSKSTYDYAQELSNTSIGYLEMTAITHPSDLPAKYGVIRIVRLNYYRISIEALCNDGTYLYKEGSLDNLPTTDFTSFVKNADLDGVLETTPGGSTAIQSGTGDVKYRLQLNPSGNVVLYQSTDGGVTWPNTKNVFSFN